MPRASKARSAENADIRNWAAAQGIDLKAKGPIPPKVRDQWANRDGVVASKLDSPAEHDDFTVPEPPPVRAPDVRQPFWRRWSDPKAEPARARPRVSIENIVAQAWGIGALMMNHPQVDQKGNITGMGTVPLARVLDAQAPVAGIVVNDIARGTAIDAVLQPLARAGAKGEKLFGLIGPPLIVGAICNKPELYPVLRQPLKFSLISWITISEPAMRKAEKRAKDFAEKFGEIDIDGMIDALFAPPQFAQPEPAEPAAA